MSEAFFTAPLDLLWLLAVAGLGVLIFRAQRTRSRTTASILGPRADALVSTGDSQGPGTALRLAGATLLVLALAGPQLGLSEDLAADARADLVICLDVSRSMLAADAVPDRLGSARAAISLLLAECERTAVALVLSAGDAQLRAPLTRDLTALAELLAESDPWSVTEGGTEPRAGIDLALATLGAGSGTHGAILFVSDGERAESACAAAAAARERGFRVHTAVVGGPRAVKIPVPGADGISTFVRTAAGDEVLSRADKESMARLAEAGGGACVDLAVDPEALRRLLREEIAPLAAAGARPGRVERTARASWPLACALLLLGAALFKRRRVA